MYTTWGGTIPLNHVRSEPTPIELKPLNKSELMKKARVKCPYCGNMNILSTPCDLCIKMDKLELMKKARKKEKCTHCGGFKLLTPWRLCVPCVKQNPLRAYRTPDIHWNPLLSGSGTIEKQPFIYANGIRIRSQHPY